MRTPNAVIVMHNTGQPLTCSGETSHVVQLAGCEEMREHLVWQALQAQWLFCSAH